jgi:predicted nucleotidyltransferase
MTIFAAKKQMLVQNQILHYLSANKQDISRKYHLKKLGIFGSYARNEQTLASDLDLLVEFEDNTPNLTNIKDFLRKEMQSVFHIPVDICREKYIKPIFRQQILADAVYV